MPTNCEKKCGNCVLFEPESQERSITGLSTLAAIGIVKPVIYGHRKCVSPSTAIYDIALCDHSGLFQPRQVKKS